MKICCMCRRDLPLSSFRKNRSQNDGLQSQCIECMRVYRRKHYLKNKDKHKESRRKHYLKNKDKHKESCKRHTIKFLQWWQEFKATYSCEICGENHPAAIVFHHPNEDKIASVSNLVARRANKEIILAEIAKCNAWCSNCHLKHHWVEY